jgi:hypothetical protein
MELKIIESAKLQIDHDVQIEFAIEERRWRAMAANWNTDAVGVLIVVPDGNGGYSIIDGRHRFLAGNLIGLGKWRCDVHSDVATPAEKARLKLAFDRDRRRVTALEHFVVRRIAQEPAVLDIWAIVEEAGFHFGKTGRRNKPNNISAVTVVERIYVALGRDGLVRVCRLAAVWSGDALATSGDWLDALGLLVRDDYDLALAEGGLDRLRSVVPATTIRQARGDLAGGDTGGRAVAYAVATRLRKVARLRPREPKVHPKAVSAKKL